MSQVVTRRTKQEARALDREVLGVPNGNAEVLPFFRHGSGKYADGRFLEQSRQAKREAGNGSGVVQITLKEPAYADVVQLQEGDTVTWGINPRHRARRPQPSPFLIHDGSRKGLEEVLSFYFVEGKLIRAHVGEPRPPLPWQSQLENLGLPGRDGSVKYWRTHAYIYAKVRWERHDMEAVPAPDWA